MLMTKEEIIRSYREAKKPKLQIKILSQLNCCSQEYIKEIVGLENESLYGSNQG